MTLTLSLLLDDGGAHIVAPSAQADELLCLFSANGISCFRAAFDDGAKLQFPKADEILPAHTLLQDWLKRTGVQGTVHGSQSANTDTLHS